VLREEQGVLPIVLAGDIAGFWDEAEGVTRSGLAGGLFHPTTGYSLPCAVRLADLILRLEDVSAPALFAAVRARAEALWRAHAFYRQLNRMLFLAGDARQRYMIMRRFYALPEPLIRRFYAGETTGVDKLRILSGKPPVPLLPALKALAARDLHRRVP
jgi:lycopene beta-cyclase